MTKSNYKFTAVSCYVGYIVQAIEANLAPILFIIFKDEYGLSYEKIGRLILINFVTQIFVDVIASKYVKKIGMKTACLFADIFAVCGLVGLSVFPDIFPSPYMGIVAATMLYAFGGGLIEVVVSPTVEALPLGEKSSSMAFLHSFYCWGQVLVVALSTIGLKIIGTESWRFIPLIWAMVPAVNFFMFLRSPFIEAGPEEKTTSLKELMSSKTFLLAMLLMICAGSSEIAMSQWASIFAQEGLGVSKMWGDLLGPCLFAVLMGIGRIGYGLFGEKIDLHKALTATSILCIACYITVAFAKIPVISLLACAVTGFSISLMWPGMLSLTEGKFPHGGTFLFGVLAVCGDIGCSLGPWLTGTVSDAVSGFSKAAGLAQELGLTIDELSLKAGLLAAIIFPVMMLTGLLLSSKRKKENR